MSTLDAPIAPGEAPLAPRIADLFSGKWRYAPIPAAFVLIRSLFGCCDLKFVSARNLSNLGLRSIEYRLLPARLIQTTTTGA